MNIQHLSLKFAYTVGLSTFILLSSNSFAAPGTLPSSPLFLSNSVEPNIMLSIDDSLSMDWEILSPEGIADIGHAADGQTLIQITPNAEEWTAVSYLVPGWATEISSVVPPVSSNPALWLLRNHEANRLYYNPDIIYSPWPGVDNSGDALYSDAIVTAVLKNPNNDGNTLNLNNASTYSEAGDLTIAVYYTWDSDDGTEGIGAGDSHTLHTITDATELQNFANWLQYHRKREYVAKAAIGSLINATDYARMGLYLSSRALVDDTKADMSVNLSSMSDSTNHANLLTTYYQSSSSSGHDTPTRTALRYVGNHFYQTPEPSPILSANDGGECQQNFNILMTDGYWNDDNTDDLDIPPGQLSSYNKDGDNTSKFDGGPDDNIDDNIDGGNYQDSVAATLADYAMAYYENDLRQDLANNVPTSSTDLAYHQHLVNYTVAFGLNGTLDPTTDPTSAGFVWPDPNDGLAEKVDDLWHAAYNSRGLYLNAQNPQELQSALASPIQDIAHRTATSAAVAVNSARLTSESVVYLAQFNSDGWQGNLQAFPIINLNLGTLSSTPSWQASPILTNRNLSTSPRQIITYDGSTGVPFAWDTSVLSAAMVADLKRNPAGNVDSDAIAEERLKYLRGDRSNEGTGLQFRARQSLLGDIVNAGPVFVGDATLNWPDATPFPSESPNRYSDFKAGIAKTRSEVVYVGANDGMLHAFNDSTGNELFAYMPNILASTETTDGYHYLTDPGYTHNWYIDQTPTLSDVYMTTANGSGWHTILIGGLRGGGRGIFALEVTNPANLTEANAGKVAMWEFSNADDSDLGYTYSRPAIAMGNDGKWYAIFGNGYNDIDGSGKAQLFILDIESGINNAWVLDTNYWKISTGVGGTGGVDENGDPDPVVERNGLATPALADVDGNGTVDRVYAGDLRGNMWVFDFSGATPGSWDSAFTGAGQIPVPLFTTPANQPITVKPVLARHPTMPIDNSTAPNLMVMFGTGQYLVDGDKSTTNAQAFYAVWDKDDSGKLAGDLIEQTYILDQGFTDRVLSKNQVDYETKYGWWISLPDSGERVITSAIARHTEVFFNTFVPTTDPCSVGGYGYKFAVDMNTGGASDEAVIDTNEDGNINESDNDGVGVIAAIKQEGYLPEPVFIEDLVFTGSVASKIKKLPYVPSGRFSWQELIKQ